MDKSSFLLKITALVSSSIEPVSEVSCFSSEDKLRLIPAHSFLTPALVLHLSSGTLPSVHAQQISSILERA